MICEDTEGCPTFFNAGFLEGAPDSGDLRFASDFAVDSILPGRCNWSRLHMAHMLDMAKLCRASSQGMSPRRFRQAK